MQRIGENIKKIRKVKRLSQQAFADLFDLTRGNISSYEEFRAEPKLEVVMKIANYFSIPLADFIEKDLSLDELLHYTSSLASEADKLKPTQHLVRIPFIPALYLDDYLKQHDDEIFLMQLPCIIVPGNLKTEFLAIEVDNSESLPVGYDYNNGDILIFEKIIKENAHRIIGRLGLAIDRNELHIGIYKEEDHAVNLYLNEWVKYPFNIESLVQYWGIKGTYTNIV